MNDPADNFEPLNRWSRSTVLDTPGPPPGVLTCARFEQRVPYQVLRRNGTRDWLVTFTLKGGGLYRQPGYVEYFTQAGDLMLLEPGAHHQYGCRPERAWHFLWAHFNPRPHWVNWLRWPALGKGLYRLHLPQKQRRPVQQAFERCLAYGRTPLASGVPMDLAMNGLEEVLLQAARGLEIERSSLRLDSPSHQIASVMEYMATQLDRQHTIRSLARSINLSPSRFAHRFKAETGDAVMAYLIKLRLQQAARLLEYSGRSVKEAAFEVGFTCPYYFSRQFRKFFGRSPKTFKFRGSVNCSS